VQSQVAACSTGAIAIADGVRMIKEGRCDIVLVGAAEGAICPLGMAGFGALRALASGYNDNPEFASRPFDKQRSGFVMGEGAGMLVLETEESAKKRNAKIYCQYLGAGLSNDAYHITAPKADGSGAAASMLDALHWSGKKANEIDYINAHATSTPLGDKAELTAFKSVFASNWSNLAISSIKGAIGHMLGAAGSVEAIATILCLHKQKLLPTLNLQEVDDAAYSDNVLVDLVPKGREAKLETVLTTAFGFGGHNVSLVFGKY
jgi:3-oxoacyl-[acyl-carrier-protein] synthase II